MRHRHPDATTLKITMTLNDPKAYTAPWVEQANLHLNDPGISIVMSGTVDRPEEESFNEGVRILTVAL